MKFLYVLLPSVILFLGACNQKKTQGTDNSDIVHILSEQDDCHQYGKTTCYKYKTSEDSDKILVHNGEIEGFDYMDSHQYTIKIKRTQEEIDGETVEKWTLDKILSEELDKDAYMVPEEITATYYERARLKKETKMQYNLSIVPGSGMVLELKRKAAYDRRIADANLTETVLIELEGQEGDFTIDGVADAVSAYYGKSCFCEYTGLADMTEFTVTAEKTENGYHAVIVVPEQNMTLVQMGETIENLPYVREERTFEADFEKGSVMKMIQESHNTAENPHAMLNGVWELEQINGEKIMDMKELPEIPVLELKVDEKMYHGRDGCNIINGAFDLDKQAISFKDGLSTKKYCHGAIDAEFMAAFKNVDSYRLLGDRLMLRNGQKTILIFKMK